MFNPDDILAQIIEDHPPFPPEDERRRQRLAQYYAGKRNKATLITSTYTLISLAFGFWGIFMIATEESTRGMLCGLLLLLASMEINVIMKLWYWIVENKISVMKTLKETQLMLLRSSTSTAPTAEETAPSAAMADRLEPDLTFWERLDPATVRRISFWGTIITTVIAANLLIATLTGSLASFLYGSALEQEDLWTLTASGQVDARAALTFAPLSKNHRVTLTLPYANAHIESIQTQDGRALEFTERKPGQYGVTGEPTALASSPWTVRWSFPAGNLPAEPFAAQVCGKRVDLHTLLPAKRYSLKYAVEAGGAYRATPGETSAFSGNTGSFRQKFGSCLLLLELAPASPAGS